MVTEVQFGWYVLILVIRKIKQKRLTSTFEYKLIKKMHLVEFSCLFIHSC